MTKYLAILVLVISSFLYTFNLEATQAFAGDTARDTLHMLTIWQEKELTLIGPPLSLGYGTTRELYFSSLSLYFGLIGLIMSNLSPIGAAYPGIVLTLFSIIAMYLLVQELTKNPRAATLGAIIYGFSPVLVAHSRFFWNPNPILPLSVFFWLALVYAAKVRSLKVKMALYFLSGLILGLIFNFHYLGILGGILFTLWLLYKKQLVALLFYILGILTGALPVILFELRNAFYLSKTLLFNIASGGEVWDLAIVRSPFVAFAMPWLSILGFTHTEIYYPTLLNLPSGALLAVAIVVIAWQFFVLRKLWLTNKDLHPYLAISLASVILLALVGQSVHTRYIWGIYPLLLTWLATSLASFRSPLVVTSVVALILGSSIVNINTPRTFSQDGVIPLKDLRTVGEIIKNDNPQDAYNVMDSATGDARGIALRYYVQKDTPIKPLGPQSYQDLAYLYVLAPSVENIYTGNRYEFTATPNLELVATWQVAEHYLYKFARTDSSL